ncbi:MAG: BtaA family protein [Betaproteobacteria bacterium]|nr:BtaA family protein [Betaproteobacteria bacterium]
MSCRPPSLAGFGTVPGIGGVSLKRDELSLLGRVDEKVFSAIYRRALVYNTCWEDPAVDHQALDIGGTDTMLAITSAGCNVLDYLLAEPRRIHAVDANPRQTALLELKVAGIRKLAYEDFFRIFGDGGHDRFREIHHDVLRGELSPFARQFWDRRLHWFTHPPGRSSFYFHGLSGIVARVFRTYLKLRPELAQAVDDMIHAPSLEVQAGIYDERVAPRLWNGPTRWALSRQITMSMLGVPHPQRREVQSQHEEGVAGYVRHSLDYVFRTFPLRSNYFWYVYLRGCYSAQACPRYLQRDGFERLKAGLVYRLVPHTCTLTEFLRRNPDPISKFVLLDHMDWMSCYHPEALAEEWALILDRARHGARAIFRSAHARPRYLEAIPVTYGTASRPLSEWLRFDPDLAQRLDLQDRVHTYAGFHIAHLPT